MSRFVILLSISVCFRGVHFIRLMMRENETYRLFQSGRLLQQYIVDQTAKIEQQRLRFIRTHQKELRADTYKGFADAINNADALYQDAMCIVAKLGKPDLFITVTCNPKWPEITAELKRSGGTTAKRPDLLARVFKLKLNAILDDILKGNCFERQIAAIYVIAFQKRGLSHAHVLTILAPADKPRTSKIT